MVADNVDCTSLTVPQDYSSPNGNKISLTISRIKASGDRKGVIIGNPGGPGISALKMFAGEFFPQAISSRYDLITVQPRGLPFGTPLDCTTDNELLAVSQTLLPGVVRHACNEKQPGYVDTITTDNVARDIEEARKALGEDRLNLYGASYGTMLMSTYATMFPAHVDKTILDSSVAPDDRWMTIGSSRKQARHTSLNAMFQWIADRDHTYHAGTTPLQVYQRWTTIVERESGLLPASSPPPSQIGDLPAALRELPLDLSQFADALSFTQWRTASAVRYVQALFGNDATLSPTLLLTLGSGLYKEGSWPDIAEVISKGFYPELPPSDRPSEQEIRDLSAFTVGLRLVDAAIRCNENLNAPQLDRLPPALIDTFTGGDVVDFGSDTLSSGLGCAGWGPQPTKARTFDGRALKTPPLLLQYNHDSAVTMKGAPELQKSMGGQVVYFEGYSHGVVPNSPAQALPIVERYLGL